MENSRKDVFLIIARMLLSLASSQQRLVEYLERAEKHWPHEPFALMDVARKAGDALDQMDRLIAAIERLKDD